MKQINQKFLTGERALFQGKDLKSMIPLLLMGNPL